MVGPITTSVHPDGPRPFTLEPGQHHQAAAVLTASHADYPAFKSVFPDRPRRVRALRPFFATTVRDAIRYGTVDGCAVDRRLSGVAAWLPPGRFPWTPSRKLRATGAMLRVAVASPSSFARFVRYGANAEKSHPAEPHWYLVVLGVRPDAQRLGIGTRLLEPALARADTDGLPCWLETSDLANVAFYRRFGFHVQDEVQLAPGGPAHMAMRRSAGKNR